MGAFSTSSSLKMSSSSEALYGPPRKVQIIPSVLPADFGKLGEDCKKLEDAGVDRIQFDVMDGNFVPNLTFGPDTISWCRKYTDAQMRCSNNSQKQRRGRMGNRVSLLSM